MSDIVYELRGLAIGMAAPSLARDTVSRAADEIERLTKERDLALANADAVYARLMPEVERLRAALKEIADHRIDSEHASREKRSMAYAALELQKTNQCTLCTISA